LLHNNACAYIIQSLHHNDAVCHDFAELPNTLKTGICHAMS